jgi:hypothetical protein
MSLNLTDDEIHGLIDYARDKFAAERYPFAAPRGTSLAIAIRGGAARVRGAVTGRYDCQ